MAKLGTSKEYSMYYGGFRGVDFSNDHTQINDQRLAYAVNMYKDYYSEQGKAIETIAGFRRRAELPNKDKIYGIHEFRKNETKHILIHSGDRLYYWHNYPLTVNVVLERTIVLPEQYSENSFKVELKEACEIIGAKNDIGDPVAAELVDGYVIIYSTTLQKGDTVYIEYKEDKFGDPLFSGMNTAKSTSFVFNNRLYILDGKNYLVYDGETVTNVSANAYVPTTYINIPVGEAGEGGAKYEPRNLLQPKFKTTYIADGTSSLLVLNAPNVTAIYEISVYGMVIGADYYEVERVDGYITKVSLTEIPKRPEEMGFTEKYAGIEITASTDIKSELVTSCTIAAVFDDRIFFSGNPDNHNSVYYCGRNAITGFIDPSYIPEINRVLAGVGDAPVTGLIPIADVLAVLKSDTQQDGSVYYLSAIATGDDLNPKIYQLAKGLSGIGCVGACINFLDDPVFVSRLGIEALGQLSVRYERALEHRSSLIDSKLVNSHIKQAVLEEWNGYLVVLIDGQIYLGDSRQTYTGSNNTMQYEWYYLDGIGVYDNQYIEYRYAASGNSAYDGITVEYQEDEGKTVELNFAPPELSGTVANEPNEEGEAMETIHNDVVTIKINEVPYNVSISYKIVERGETYKGYYCYTDSNYTGGTFRPAVCVKTIDNNLFFGTENGVVCSFNFDKRTEEGTIPSQYYAFDGRTILCGCATKMDSCGIPHLTKSTIKKSTVVKTKNFSKSAAKIKVRTNRKAYNQIARINSAVFSFEDMDFADFTFETSEQSLFSVKEAEKKWVEKQYYVYSDEYMKPFALYYVAYRYKIAGRYKE